MTLRKILETWTPFIVALCLLAQASSAQAARILKYDIQSRDTFVVTAYSDQPTILAFPYIVAAAIDQGMGESSPIEPMVWRYSKEVLVVPRKGVKNATTFLEVMTENATVRIVVNLVDRKHDQAHDRVEFYDGHGGLHASQEVCQRDLNTTMAHMYFKGGNEIPFDHEAIDGTGTDDFEIEGLRFHRMGSLQQFIFKLHNLTNSTLPIESIRMYDSERRSEHTTYVEFDLPSTDPEVMAEIPPGKTAMVYLQVDNLDHLGATPYLYVIPRDLPLQGRQIWPFGNPHEEPRVPAPNEGRVSVQVQGVAGAVSLIDPLDSSSSGELTSVTGFGVRVQYGFNGMTSFVGSLDLLSTGNADFDDMSVEASTARFVFGATLHTGETYVPYVRAGIGFRVSNYTMSPAGAPQDTALRSSGLLNVGGGLDLWRGESFVVGVSMNYIAGLTGEDNSYSLEAGLHAGYGWKPKPDRRPRASRR